MASSAAPTNSPFEALPLEIHHQILSYLCGPYAGVQSSTGLRPTYAPSPPPFTKYLQLHPYLTLASTCANLNVAVESFTQFLLFQHRSVTGIDVPSLELPERWVKGKDGQNRQTEGFGVKRGKCYRMVWLKWARRNCAWCGKKSVRFAMFNQLILCCGKCERESWDQKIVSPCASSAEVMSEDTVGEIRGRVLTMYTQTMSEVKKQYQLAKIDLFRPNPIFASTSSEMPPPYDVLLEGMLRPKYCMYDCSGVTTTLFFRKEVEALAEFVHGDDAKSVRTKRHGKRQKEDGRMEWYFVNGRWRAAWKDTLVASREEILRRVMVRETHAG